MNLRCSLCLIISRNWLLNNKCRTPAWPRRGMLQASGHVCFVLLASEVRHGSLWLSASSLSPASIFTASEEPHQLWPVKMERLQSEPLRADTWNIQLYITTVEVTVFHTNFSKWSFYSISRPAGLLRSDQQGSSHSPSFIISKLPPPILTAWMYRMAALACTKDCFLHDTQQRRTSEPTVQTRARGLLEPSYCQGSCTKAVYRSLPTWTRLLE